jgi:transcriptional regulator with XRE-family HTH domain
MTLKRSTPSPASAPATNPYRHILGAAVESRRLQMGLTVDDAAVRAGFEPRQWIQLELGAWAPEDDITIYAIAASLKCDPTAISFLALVSRHNR